MYHFFINFVIAFIILCFLNPRFLVQCCIIDKIQQLEQISVVCVFRFLNKNLLVFKKGIIYVVYSISQNYCYEKILVMAYCAHDSRFSSKIF